MRSILLASALAAVLATTASAQTPSAVPASGAAQNAQVQGGGRGAAVVSPEVSADGRVTVRLRAPDATSVTVTGLGVAPLPMTKDAQGVWSATTAAALPPEIYPYSFTVDSVRVPDPGNMTNSWAGMSAGASAATSTLFVPGEPWSNTDAPHGAVAKHVYKSAIIGASETYFVYTPPGYDPKRKAAYPVVVLLHGLGNNAQDWITQAGANLTLDTLITEGKAVPMILVTPASYGNADGQRGAAAGFPNFTKALIEEIMPQVEKGYNASKKATDHAISGLSMGAAQSLLLLNRLDQFTWIGSFSPGFDMYAPTWGQPAAGGNGANGSGRGGAAAGAPTGVRMRPVLADGNLASIFPTLDGKANSKIKLLYIACGTEDDHLALTQQFKTFLDARGVKVTSYLEVPGFAHVWPFWRRQFASFAPLLFKSPK